MECKILVNHTVILYCYTPYCDIVFLMNPLSFGGQPDVTTSKFKYTVRFIPDYVNKDANLLDAARGRHRRRPRATPRQTAGNLRVGRGQHGR